MSCYWKRERRICLTHPKTPVESMEIPKATDQNKTSQGGVMPRMVRRRLVVLVAILSLLLPARAAKADEFGRDVALAVVAIVVVTAAITTAVVLSIRHHPSITGCATQGANGFEITSEGSDPQLYLLTGDTVGVKAGERIKVQGKKNGKDAMGSRHFFVEKIKKDYGACHVP